MSDVLWPLRRSPEGTRRNFRRDQELQLRLRGEYGPEWWQVLPGFTLLLLGIAVPLFTIGWLWSRLGWWAALLGAVALAYAARAVVLRRRQAVARKKRRAVCFTLDQVDAADDRGFRTIVGRLLVRDGWTQVRGVRISGTVVHLVGNGPDGRQLGLAFERGIERPGEEDGGRAALRPVSGAPRLPNGVEPGPRPLFVVVSSGSFARERVLWAARTDVRLVDRAMLQRWAAGADLAVLLDLGLDDVRPDAS
ncbi:hypothetical protein OOK58_59190 [Streptomyces sp. NBC_01728]|uniref:hypothetical protein n=1 Tax=unclassified Streptomyces TaxID=2593676 RepID=UPI000CC53380|nr:MULTISPECIES: hypothetical protein [unclassified Streptomyces]MCX4462436.1 hypothetical protein [Streptomyces sp. NBC_01719]MCX4500866.1 hypothetical protein [Streptomyces sp. NBC_01728]